MTKNTSSTQPRDRSNGKAPGRSGNMIGDKPKSFKSAAKNFIGYAKPYTLAIIIAFILSALGAVCTIIGPDKLGEITNIIMDGAMTEIDLAAVGEIGLFLAVLFGIGAIASYGQGFIMASVTQKLCYSMRDKLSIKINRLPLSYFDKIKFGDVLSRVTNDVDTMGQTLNMSIGQLTNATMLFVGSLIMMLLSSPILTLVAVGSTIFGFALMMIIVSRSQKYFKAQQDELGNINGHIEEVYSSLNVVRAYNAEEYYEEKFTEINDRLHKSAWKSQFISGIMMPMMHFVGNLGYVSVCVAGAILAFNGKIEFGVIVSFMIYVRLFSQPLSQFAQAMTSLQSTAAATERIFDFLGETELTPESENAIDKHVSVGEVEFKDVHFSYTPERKIVNGFTAKALPGQKIAIVGPTGSGKTTIVNLLMRFYEPDSGEIYVDGVPISQMTRRCVHELFGMVLQDTWMFDGSIRDNISFSIDGVTHDEVESACKAVGLDHYINTLPKGYDTILADNTSLSAGQKQLLTIARAIVENSPLLILDEATSSVDTRTEIQIQKAMNTLTVGRTSFIIAHRLSTIKSADLILVMNAGEIIERGNHIELLAKKGFYADLYNSQFDDNIV